MAKNEAHKGVIGKKRKASNTLSFAKRRFIIGCEELEDGMIIGLNGDLEKAREIVNEMIDIHEIDDEGEIIE